MNKWFRKHLVDLLCWALKEPPEKAHLGTPYLGQALCKCGHSWKVFAPQGLDKDIKLECPSCDKPRACLV